MNSLNAEQIRAANDRKPRLKQRPVPEWNGDVYLRSWTGKEREEFQEFTRRLASNETATGTVVSPLRSFAEVCVRGLADQDGNALFNGEGIDILMGKDFFLVKQLAEEIITHNGLGPRAAEQVEKNSLSSQSSDSGTSLLAI